MKNYHDDAYWDASLDDEYRNTNAGAFGSPSYTLCRTCGTLCLWKTEPGKGWRLYVNGEKHVCPVNVAEMEVVG
jgi:hypothetical protein